MALAMEPATRALAPDGGPAGLAELTAGGRLAVGSFRRWLQGAAGDTGLHGRLLWRGLVDALGEQDAHVALLALSRMIKTLQSYARRRFAYHQPCCGALTLDEIAVLGLLTACQRRQLQLARGRALWLVHADGLGDCLDAACTIAAVLRNNGLALDR